MSKGNALGSLAAVVVALMALNLTAGISAKFVALLLPSLLPALLPAALMAICYAGRLVLWLYAGRRWQLSYLYPILSLNYIAAAVAGRLIFGEAISPHRVVGLALLLAGVLVCALSPHRHEQRESTP